MSTQEKTRPGGEDRAGFETSDRDEAGQGEHIPAPRGRSMSRQWAKAVADSTAASAARRERVLQHPDLVDRLRQAPLALPDPRRWSGWIPPKTLPEDTCPGCRGNVRRPACDGLDHHARANDSPIRRQLVDIAAEAMRREADAA